MQTSKSISAHVVFSPDPILIPGHHFDVTDWPIVLCLTAQYPDGMLAGREEYLGCLPIFDVRHFVAVDIDIRFLECSRKLPRAINVQDRDRKSTRLNSSHLGIS